MYSTTFDEAKKVWSGAELDLQIDKKKNFGEYLLEKLGNEDSERVMQVNKYQI